MATELKLCKGKYGCGLKKPHSSFGKKKDMRDGLQPYCKDCVNKMSSAYRSTRREHYRELNKKYRSEDHGKDLHRVYEQKRRSSSVGVIPSDYLEILIDLFGSSCMNPNCLGGLKLTVDHIVPLSKGGLHCISNMQLLCNLCNIQKGNRVIVDYRPFKYYFEEE